MIEKNYGILNFNFIDKIIVKKRFEMLEILEQNINKSKLLSMLDIGTVDDDSLESSNFFLKHFKNINVRKSISNQKINTQNFNMCLNKSITSIFSKENLDDFKSDLVISSATIEHVGNYTNQKKMLENISTLCNKVFFITTPNRFFPIDFHTKIPFIHMLPKRIHRSILRLIGLNEYAKEENLNLLCEKDIENLINENKNDFNIKIFKIKLFGFISNFIILGVNKNL